MPVLVCVFMAVNCISYTLYFSTNSTVLLEICIYVNVKLISLLFITIIELDMVMVNTNVTPDIRWTTLLLLITIAVFDIVIVIILIILMIVDKH